MEAIPALLRYSVWCPIQESFLVMREREGRGERGGGRGGRERGGKREGGREREEGGGREGRERERRMTYEMILFLGRR